MNKAPTTSSRFAPRRALPVFIAFRKYGRALDPSQIGETVKKAVAMAAARRDARARLGDRAAYRREHHAYRYLWLASDRPRRGGAWQNHHAGEGSGRRHRHHPARHRRRAARFLPDTDDGL